MKPLPIEDDSESTSTDAELVRRDAGRIAMDAATRMGRACQILGECGDGETAAELADQLHLFGLRAYPKTTFGYE